MVRFNADMVPWYSERVHLGDGRSVLGGGVVRKKNEDGRGMDERGGRGALIERL